MKAADTIVVAGGGPIGLELAGDLRKAHPSKKIILVCRDGVLSQWPEKTCQLVTQALEAQKFQVISGRSGGNSEGIPTEAKLEAGTFIAGGAKIAYDAFIPAYSKGPNTQFLQSSGGALDGKGRVVVNEFLQSKTCPEIFCDGGVRRRQADHAHEARSPTEVRHSQCEEPPGEQAAGQAFGGNALGEAALLVDCRRLGPCGLRQRAAAAQDLLLRRSGRLPLLPAAVLLAVLLALHVRILLRRADRFGACQGSGRDANHHARVPLEGLGRSREGARADANVWDGWLTACVFALPPTSPVSKADSF